MGPSGPLIRPGVDLVLDPRHCAVCRLPPSAPWPVPPPGATLYSVTVTADELSVVCHEGDEPPAAQVESGWRALAVVGPLKFDQVGIISSMSVPLAAAHIGVFVMSTFDTDLVLVKDVDIDAAIYALDGAGHRVAQGAA
jgi:hypothetical protein